MSTKSSTADGPVLKDQTSAPTPTSTLLSKHVATDPSVAVPATTPDSNDIALKDVAGARTALPIEEDIMQLARLGEVAAMKALFDKGKFDVHHKDDEGITPLHWAAINNQYAMCQYLLDAGADVNAIGGESKATPVMWAAQRCHYYVVHLLLQRGADPLASDCQGYNVLHLATFDGNVFLLAILLHQNIPVDVPDRLGHTSLMWAAYKGFPACVDLFLRWGANVYARDEMGFTALHWSLVKGPQIYVSQACVQSLLEYGADRFAETNDGKTPATTAAEMKCVPIWRRALAESGYDEDGHPVSHRFPLASLVKDKRLWLTRFYFLWPFVIVWCALMILSHLVIFLAIPMAGLVVYGLQWVAVQLSVLAPANMRRFEQTPFLAGFFAGLCFWVGVRWLTTILPHTIYSSPWTNLAFAVAYGMCTWFYACSMLFDPGYVPKQGGRSQEKETIDELLKLWKFDDPSFCMQCMVRRPLRSKHCRRCGRCVAKHDHHCPWVYNCVGVNNHRPFILYLVSMEVGIVLLVRLNLDYLAGLSAPWNSECNILAESLCREILKDPYTVILTAAAGLQTIWVTMLMLVQMVQIVRAQTTFESMRGHHHHDRATEVVTSALTAGTTSLEGAGLASPGGGPEGMAHAHPHPHHHEGYFARWKKLLGLDTFVATAVSGYHGRHQRQRNRNPFSRGIMTNCQDFLCDPAPLFGPRETGAAMLGGERVNYTKLYETPSRMRMTATPSVTERGAYQSIDEDEMTFHQDDVPEGELRGNANDVVDGTLGRESVSTQKLAVHPPESVSRSRRRHISMDLTRNQIFQRLKPPCVALSQAALRYGREGGATGKELVAALETLDGVVAQVAQPKLAFDPKLADYVFFPLSHVLQRSQAIPVRALELTIDCVRHLLESGWRCELPVEVGQQLHILLAFIAGGHPARKTPEKISEELQLAAFKCLTALFHAFLQSSRQRTLTETANVPALGHLVTVLLKGIEEGASTEVQLSAIDAFDAFQPCIEDRDALVSFLPGTVSSLTKTLQPTTRSKRTGKVLVGCLGLLGRALVTTLDDINFTTEDEEASTPDDPSKSWLKATASQVKMFLANVVKLRHHDRREVRQALAKFCQTIIEHCRKSLSESIPMLFETWVEMEGRASLDGDGEGDGAAALTQLARRDPSILEFTKMSLHNWVVSFPRVMQSPDERTKQRAINQLSTAFRLLSDSEADSLVVDDLLATNLRTSVAAAISASKSVAISAVGNGDEGDEMRLGLRGSIGAEVPKFHPILMAHHSQQESLRELELLIRQLSRTSSSVVLLREILSEIHAASGDGLLAGMWLAVIMLSGMQKEDTSMADFIVADLAEEGEGSVYLEELYSYSLSILATPWEDKHQDWRLQGLALEAVALQAQHLGRAFRNELADALYPVVHLIGSPNPQLREHAMTSLDLIARSSGYGAASEVIIDNVDYLVNAVALKLNTFDISPQAPQAILMMIKLTGPSLLPYLDDLVGSIFAALESFHGYPRLVELLFSVLRGIVEEAARADGGLTKEGERPSGNPVAKRRTVDDVATILRGLQPRTEEEEQEWQRLEPTPHKAWKHIAKDKAEAEAGDEDEDDEEEQTEGKDEDEDEDDPQPGPESKKAPPSKIYKMTQSIALLTQHYLTHADAHLRTSLLELLCSACVPLSQDEDAFLPLLNSLWPVIISRLSPMTLSSTSTSTSTSTSLSLSTTSGALLMKPEPSHATATTLNLLTTLFRTAGSFLTSRVLGEWKGRFVPFLRSALAVNARHKRPEVWKALLEMLDALVLNVTLDGPGSGGGGGSQGWEVVDDILGFTVRGELWSGSGKGREREGEGGEAPLRKTLQSLHPDATWLAIYTHRHHHAHYDIGAGAGAGAGTAGVGRAETEMETEMDMEMELTLKKPLLEGFVFSDL
ncbi:MAG: palmitoyltransferase akr1 [Thelocarpon superellum]|nr:MAG: palmitoyltransferase akr1 [Thelocarpon superellum]